LGEIVILGRVAAEDIPRIRVERDHRSGQHRRSTEELAAREIRRIGLEAGATVGPDLRTKRVIWFMLLRRKPRQPGRLAELGARGRGGIIAAQSIGRRGGPRRLTMSDFHIARPGEPRSSEASKARGQRWRAGIVKYHTTSRTVGLRDGDRVATNRNASRGVAEERGGERWGAFAGYGDQGSKVKADQRSRTRAGWSEWDPFKPTRILTEFTGRWSTRTFIGRGDG